MGMEDYGRNTLIYNSNFVGFAIICRVCNGTGQMIGDRILASASSCICLHAEQLHKKKSDIATYP
jgi:hypothetical protein